MKFEFMLGNVEMEVVTYYISIIEKELSRKSLEWKLQTKSNGCYNLYLKCTSKERDYIFGNIR